jgi:hypothetical protein
VDRLHFPHPLTKTHYSLTKTFVPLPPIVAVFIF